MHNTFTWLDRFHYLSNKFSTTSSDQIHLFVIWLYISSLYSHRIIPIRCASPPLILMDHIPDSEDIPPMPLVSTVCDSGTFSLADAGGYSGMGGRAKFTNWRTKLLPIFFVVIPAHGVAWE